VIAEAIPRTPPSHAWGTPNQDDVPEILRAVETEEAGVNVVEEQLHSDAYEDHGANRRDAAQPPPGVSLAADSLVFVLVDPAMAIAAVSVVGPGAVEVVVGDVAAVRTLDRVVLEVCIAAFEAANVLAWYHD
jgi:hypothetical protein